MSTAELSHYLIPSTVVEEVADASLEEIFDVRQSVDPFEVDPSRIIVAEQNGKKLLFSSFFMRVF